MRKETLIAQLLWSAVVQTALLTAAPGTMYSWSADVAPAPLPLPPVPTNPDMPAPKDATTNKALVPEPASVPAASSALPPAASATPAPQADSVSTGRAASGNEFCHTCGRGCRAVDCRELPFGACTTAACKTQIRNGVAARLVLYQYDFCEPEACDGYKLSAKGYERLEDIARMFPAGNLQPIVIETTPENPKLDAARREHVWKALLQMNAAVPDHLVVVGHPRMPALNGQEALILHANLLKQTQSGGLLQGTAGGGASGGASGGGSTSGGSGASGTSSNTSSGGNQGQ